MSTVYKNASAVNDILPIRSVAAQTPHAANKPSKPQTTLPAADSFYEEQVNICKLFKLFQKMMYLDVNDVISSLADYDATDSLTAAKMKDHYKGRQYTIAELCENNPHVDIPFD